MPSAAKLTLVGLIARAHAKWLERLEVSCSRSTSLLDASIIGKGASLAGPAIPRCCSWHGRSGGSLISNGTIVRKLGNKRAKKMQLERERGGRSSGRKEKKAPKRGKGAKAKPRIRPRTTTPEPAALKPGEKKIGKDGNKQHRRRWMGTYDGPEKELQLHQRLLTKTNSGKPARPMLPAPKEREPDLRNEAGEDCEDAGQIASGVIASPVAALLGLCVGSWSAFKVRLHRGELYQLMRLVK